MRTQPALKRISKQPTDITPIFLEAVLMPNGEIIHEGKTISTFKNSRQFILINHEK